MRSSCSRTKDWRRTRRNGLRNSLRSAHKAQRSLKKMLTGTEKGWSNGEVHLVDEPRAKVLLNRCRTTANPNISSVGSLGGATQRGMNALRDEVKCRAAVHCDRRTRVIRQHEAQQGSVVLAKQAVDIVRPGVGNYSASGRV